MFAINTHKQYMYLQWFEIANFHFSGHLKQWKKIQKNMNKSILIVPTSGRGPIIVAGGKSLLLPGRDVSYTN